jgi:hypothetical protein
MVPWARLPYKDEKAGVVPASSFAIDAQGNWSGGLCRWAKEGKYWVDLFCGFELRNNHHSLS